MEPIIIIVSLGLNLSLGVFQCEQTINEKMMKQKHLTVTWLSVGVYFPGFFCAYRQVYLVHCVKNAEYKLEDKIQKGISQNNKTVALFVSGMHLFFV